MILYNMRRLLALSLAVIMMLIVNAKESLSIVDIEGSKYYYYVVDKNDSLYGIAKRFGWDESIIISSNPHSNKNLKKGQRIYYPVESVTEQQALPATDTKVVAEVTHEVKKGDTVYSIAQIYGLTPADIYAANPDSKYGIKVGEKLVVQKASTATGEDNIVYYTVKSGDTLYSLANIYNTSVADILSLNPGVSESNFRSGSIVKVRVDSNLEQVEMRSVEHRQINSFIPYKIEKNDTWAGIATAHGISTEELRIANEGIINLKKGHYLSIPVYETVVIDEQYIEKDPRETTVDGREELYAELHNQDDVLITDEQSVNVGVLLNMAKNNDREREFLRGVLTAVDKLGDKDYKIYLNVYDVTAHEAALDSVLNLPEFKSNDMIITTFDNNFPQKVVDFGDSNEIEVINVFDVKSDLYNTSPAFVQVLPPTQLFNDMVIDYVLENFESHKFVFVGESAQSGTPSLDSQLKELLENQGISFIEAAGVNEIETIDFAEDGTQYLICPQLTKKEDVKAFLAAMTKISELKPGLNLSVLSRPNWIVYMDQFKDEFASFDTYIPSRFYYDENLEETKDFSSRYKQIYKSEPIMSDPVYSALGYDVACFFIENCAYNKGDYNIGHVEYNAVQTDFNLHRMSNWSGFVNKTVFLIHLSPYGSIARIPL